MTAIERSAHQRAAEHRDSGGGARDGWRSADPGARVALPHAQTSLSLAAFIARKRESDYGIAGLARTGVQFVEGGQLRAIRINLHATRLDFLLGSPDKAQPAVWN